MLDLTKAYQCSENTCEKCNGQVVNLKCSYRTSWNEALLGESTDVKKILTLTSSAR